MDLLSRDCIEESDQIENFDFQPEMLSTKDLQILKPEPWGNLSYEEVAVVNPLSEAVKEILVDPLPFDVMNGTCFSSLINC